MDEHISNWITEFLIREAPNSSLVTEALTNLPIQNPTTRLKKSLLLRSIQSEIDEASLSEKTIESLELLEELTLQDGSHPTTTPLLDSMKEAYLAVAVECTLKYLIVSEKKYSDAVDRIWRRRILLRRRSSSNGSVLMTDELVRWGERIEEAVSDEEKRRSLIMENSRARAFNSVMVFLKEARDDMGPSFLQAAAETLTLEEDEDKRKEKEVLEKNVEFETSNPNPNADEVEERGGQVRPTTPFVSETRKSLKASCMELQAMVKDPLPDALRLAHSLASRPSSSGGAGAGANANAGAGAGADANVGAGADANAGARFLPFTGNNRPNLMERKPSARTYEWDDSPEAERNGGPHLPSPERIAVSPLKKYGNLKFAKRRKKRKWSLEEEDTLRKGVERFGKGNWKLILNCYREIFEERTEVDLKDKWRNMTR